MLAIKRARLQWLVLILLSFALMTGATEARAAFRVPALTGPVVDAAGIIPADVAQRLDTALRALNEQTQTQINVLTVPDLGGLEINQASIQVTDQWKLGRAKTDKGVLLLIAQAEHRIRIEVGQGNEGSLTDIESKQIIDQIMTPQFHAGNPGQGVLYGVYAIASKVEPQFDMRTYLDAPNLRTGRDPRGSGRQDPLSGGVVFIFIILFVIFWIVSRFRGGGRGGGGGGSFLAGALLGSLGNGGGGGGFGGGSGGGWGGGGGGFSGGGASGGW